MHLDPANLRRVVDTALLINQSPLVPNYDFAQDTDAEVFTVPSLTAGWRTRRGLDTRLDPGVFRPITSTRMPPTVEPTPCTYTSGTRSFRRRKAFYGAHCGALTQRRRVTAVVVDDLEEFFVAAVTRMVLVGRGGVRLHEEVFLAGVRLRGRRDGRRTRGGRTRCRTRPGRPGPRR